MVTRDEQQTHQALQQIPKLLGDLNKTLAKIGGSRLAHEPAVAPARDGSWGVYCIACSAEAQSYVTECLQPNQRTADWPPAQLYANVNRDALHKLEEVRKIASAVLLDTPTGDPRQFVAQAIISAITE